MLATIGVRDRRVLAIVAVVSLLLVIALLRMSLLDFALDTSGYAFLSILASLMPVIGYVGLFVFLLLENASVPLPAEVFLPLAGYYVFVGRLSLAGVLAVSSLASLLGTVAIFSLALKLGPSRVYWGATKLGISQKTLAKSEVRLCGKNGPLLIFLSRFIPIFGSAIVLPAGALRMSFSKVALMSLLGSVGATSAYVLLGYVLGPVILPYKNILSSIVIQNILYALVLAFALYVTYYGIRKLSNRRAKEIFVQKTLRNKARFQE